MSKPSDKSNNPGKLEKDESSVALIKEKGLLCRNPVLSPGVVCSGQTSQDTGSGLKAQPCSTPQLGLRERDTTPPHSQGKSPLQQVCVISSGLKQEH